MDLGKLNQLSHHRECKICGAEFETNNEQSALEQFSDHTTLHNPTGGQWVGAHQLIQAGRGKSG